MNAKPEVCDGDIRTLRERKKHALTTFDATVFVRLQTRKTNVRTYSIILLKTTDTSGVNRFRRVTINIIRRKKKKKLFVFLVARGY